MVNKSHDRRGNIRWEVSKRWPDGSRFRRFVPNNTVGKKLLARIEESIAMGTWRTLKEELAHEADENVTIQAFSQIYLNDYCRVRNQRPDFKEETLEVINRFIGGRQLKKFTAADAHYFERERAKEVAPATVNRGLAVLSNLFTFARKQGLIASNPMELYGRLPEDEKALRIMEPAEERLLVEKTLEIDPVVGAYVGILGETGLRMTEGMQLKWEYVNLARQQLTVEASKNYRTRNVPLSDFALELLRSLTRMVGNPYVFVRLSTKERLRAPRKEFEAGKIASKVTWVGLHDLRHFRATQWLRHGVDIRNVKEWLGHQDIQTTMRYLHFVEGYAEKQFAVAQKAELKELGGRQAGD